MIAFLDTERAREEAMKMARSMLSSSSYSFPPSDEYPLSAIRDSSCFAVMIAEDGGGNERMLRAFSGFLQGRATAPGYVNPCFSERRFREISEGNDGRIHELTRLIEGGDSSLIEERRRLTAETLGKLNALYSFSTWDGKRIPMPENTLAGTGDCAGLRLINTALRKHWEMKGLAEFTIGSDGNLSFRAPCEERCGRLLPSMLGLRILYIDSSIAVIDKEAGMLSVPGRGEEKRDSASYRFHQLFPSSPGICHTHRLDMDTSGLLILALTKEAHRSVSMQFESGQVRKEYEAVLEGVLKEEEGMIEAPIRLDVDNRPYQIVDQERGKYALTRWKRLRVEIIGGRKCTRVRFQPATGRTHQLRVHSAYIGHPIKGDRLYGTRAEGERLLLHASSIAFIHPDTGKEVSFSSPAPF